MFGLLKPRILPGFPPVHRTVDTVSVADRALTVVLPSPHPNHICVVGIDDNTGDRVGTLFVKDRRERNPGVVRLPDSSSSHTDKIFFLIVRVDGKISDPARGPSRSDTPELQTREDS